MKVGWYAAAVVDGEDMSSYDVVDEQQQQKENDADMLDELQHELTSCSLGGLYLQHFGCV